MNPPPAPGDAINDPQAMAILRVLIEPQVLSFGQLIPKTCFTPDELRKGLQILVRKGVVLAFSSDREGVAAQSADALRHPQRFLWGLSSRGRQLASLP